MLEVEKPADMAAHVGQDVGTSEWVLVDQERINKFADATGDHQWIHVDIERARKEMPGGKTIAHGFLTLSLLPAMSPGNASTASSDRQCRVRMVAAAAWMA